MRVDMRLAIVFVGSVCLLSVLGIIVLALASVDLPGILTTLAVSSLTLIGGLLAQPNGESKSSGEVDPWEKAS